MLIKPGYFRPAKTRVLPLLLLIATAFVSCTKEGLVGNNNVILRNSTNSGNANLTYSAQGKWSVSKIEAYTLNVAGNQSNTVTYQKPLADSNYVQFNQDGTCLWNADHYYVYGENGSGVIRQSGFRLRSYQYSVHGLSIDMLAPQPPEGPHATPESENATFLGPNSLVIHSTYSLSADKWVVSDTYFTRQ